MIPCTFRCFCFFLCNFEPICPSSDALRHGRPDGLAGKKATGGPDLSWLWWPTGKTARLVFVLLFQFTMRVRQAWSM